MGYSNFKKLEQVTKKFGLSALRQKLFENIQKVPISAWLAETLALADLIPLRNEKAKSERIIAQVLIEVAKEFQENLTLFSGEPLEVDSSQDLNGECDFFFTLVPQGIYLEAPIISLAEAKDEDLDYGIAQCAAQLYGAKLFNEAEGKDFAFLYGGATDGDRWKFMKFEKGVFYIDTKTYTDVGEVLGIWHYIIHLYL